MREAAEVFTVDVEPHSFCACGVVRVDAYEVVVQRLRDANQPVGVDAFRADDAVDCRAVAVDEPGKPCVAHTLLPQPFMDKISDMDVFVVFHNKKVWLQSLSN